MQERSSKVMHIRHDRSHAVAQRVIFALCMALCMQGFRVSHAFATVTLTVQSEGWVTNHIKIQIRSREHDPNAAIRLQPGNYDIRVRYRGNALVLPVRVTADRLLVRGERLETDLCRGPVMYEHVVEWPHESVRADAESYVLRLSDPNTLTRQSRCDPPAEESSWSASGLRRVRVRSATGSSVEPGTGRLYIADFDAGAVGRDFMVLVPADEHRITFAIAEGSRRCGGDAVLPAGQAEVTLVCELPP